MAKRIWKDVEAKPRSAGMDPIVGILGQLCPGNLGLETAGRQTAGRTGQCPPHMLSRGWLRPAQEGTDLWDRAPHWGPSGLLGRKREGPTTAAGIHGAEPPSSPRPLPPRTCPWATPQLGSNPSHCPCEMISAAIKRDETGEGADPLHFLTSVKENLEQEGHGWQELS